LIPRAMSPPAPAPTTLRQALEDVAKGKKSGNIRNSKLTMILCNGQGRLESGMQGWMFLFSLNADGTPVF